MDGGYEEAHAAMHAAAKDHPCALNLVVAHLWPGAWYIQMDFVTRPLS